jgi:hypothetical protein
VVTGPLCKVIHQAFIVDQGEYIFGGSRACSRPIAGVEEIKT